MAAPLDRNRPSRHLLLHPRRGNSSGDGFLVPDHAGAGDGARRRIGLRQVDGRACGPARSPGRRAHHERRDPLRGPRHGEPQRRGAPRDPRLEDRDGLSGADGLAQSDHAGRAPAHGSAADPRQGLARGGAQARHRHGQGRAPARSRARHARLSPSAERRPAAARRHRDGAALEPEAPHPRRADHRARRHGRGGHRRPRQGPHRPHRHLDPVHLPQSRPHPRDLRRSHRDVFGRGGRGRRGPRRVWRSAPSLYPGPLPLDADARHEQERQSARSHSRPVAAAP